MKKFSLAGAVSAALLATVPAVAQTNTVALMQTPKNPKVVTNAGSVLGGRGMVAATSTDTTVISLVKPDSINTVAVLGVVPKGHGVQLNISSKQFSYTRSFDEKMKPLETKSLDQLLQNGPVRVLQLESRKYDKKLDGNITWFPEQAAEQFAGFMTQTVLKYGPVMKQQR